MEEQKTSKSPLVTMVAVAAGVIFGSAVVHHYINPPANFDQAIMATASQINKNLPMMVDKETRLDNTMAGPGKTIIYRYTLINRSAADVSKDRLIAAIRPQALANYKTSDAMKGLRENGVTMQYQYSDKSGVFIGEFSISPKDF